MNQLDAETAAARAQALRELELAEKQFEQSLEDRRFVQKLAARAPKVIRVILLVFMPFIGFFCGHGVGGLVFDYPAEYNFFPFLTAVAGGFVGLVISLVALIVFLVKRFGQARQSVDVAAHGKTIEPLRKQ